MSITTGIHHVAFKAHDTQFDQVVAFYHDIMEFPIIKFCGEGADRAAVLDSGNGVCVEIFANGTLDKKEDGPIAHFAFWVDDVDGAIEKIRAAGGMVTVEPMNIDLPTEPITSLRVGFFRGPLGELIEFYYEK